MEILNPLHFCPLFLLSLRFKLHSFTPLPKLKIEILFLFYIMLFSCPNKENIDRSVEIYEQLPPWCRGILSGVICPICKKILLINLYDYIDDLNSIIELCMKISAYLRESASPYDPEANDWAEICKNDSEIQHEIARFIECHIADFEEEEDEEYEYVKAIAEFEKAFEERVQELMAEEAQAISVN